MDSFFNMTNLFEVSGFLLELGVIWMSIKELEKAYYKHRVSLMVFWNIFLFIGTFTGGYMMFFPTTNSLLVRLIIATVSAIIFTLFFSLDTWREFGTKYNREKKPELKPKTKKQK